MKKDLEECGIVSGAKVSRKGNVRGGKPFSRGALYHLLSSPIYIGEIRHKHDRHAGLHEPLVSPELWERVQQQLINRAARHGEGRKTEAVQSPLAGKLFDDSGEPLYVQGAAKGERRYRYYVSKSLVKGESQEAEQGWRLAAPEIERTISTAAQAMLADRAAIALALEESGVEPNRLVPSLKSAATWISRLQSTGENVSAFSELIERVDLSREGVRLSLKLPLPPTNANGDGLDHLAVNKFFPMQMKRRGVELRLVLEGDATPNRVNLPLLKTVARARRWSQDLLSGQVKSVGELAKREGLDRRSVRRLIWLGFLSPRIVEAIAEGRQPLDLTVIGLTRRIDLPLLWSAQESALSIR